MASKFWVGGGSSTNWSATGPSNWANSDGGAGNQTVPAAGDAIYFTANSGTGGVILNSVAASFTQFDCSGSRNSFSGGASVTLTAGNLKLPDGVGAAWSVTSTITLSATSGTQQIKCNGFTIRNLTLNGSGGTFQLQDNLLVETSAAIGTLTLTAGTFDCQTYTVACAIFATTGTGTRAISGSGAWTITNTTTTTGTLWNGGGANLTLTNFTSNITFVANCTNGKTIAFTAYTIQGTVTVNLQTGGALTFGSSSASTFSSLVTINGASGIATTIALNNTFNGGLTIVGPLSLAITGSNTIAGLNISGQVGVTLTNGQTQTLSGTVSISGDKTNQVGLQSSTFNANSTLSMASGTPTLNWLAIHNITCSGGATFNATNAYDLGGNSGVTMTPPPVGISRSRLHLGH